MKYANAISPERIKATGRVNRPRMISVLPTVSKLAASPGTRLNRVIGRVVWRRREIEKLVEAMLQIEQPDHDS
jgi:hypothetical protein